MSSPFPPGRLLHQEARRPGPTLQSLAIKWRANLQQRLKRLEARVKSADEPEEFVIEFVGADKEVVSTLVIQLGAPASPVGRNGSTQASR
jgi:hypothetical protein